VRKSVRAETRPAHSNAIVVIEAGGQRPTKEEIAGTQAHIGHRWAGEESEKLQATSACDLEAGEHQSKHATMPAATYPGQCSTLK
jgi:hypothetical protein